MFALGVGMAIKQFYIGLIYDSFTTRAGQKVVGRLIDTDLVNDDVGDFLAKIPDELNENTLLLAGITRVDGETIPFVDGVVASDVDGKHVMTRVSDLRREMRDAQLRQAWSFAAGRHELSGPNAEYWQYQSLLPRSSSGTTETRDWEPDRPFTSWNAERAHSPAPTIMKLAADMRAEPPPQFGKVTVAKLAAYLEGCESAFTAAHVPVGVMSGYKRFQSFVSATFKASPYAPCDEIISSMATDEESAVQLFWDLWDSFLASLESNS